MMGVAARSNVAVHVCAVSIVTTGQLAAPVQSTNAESAAAVAVSVTAVPWRYASVQSAPQAIPAGAAETVPLPVPAFVTVSVRNTWSKVAVQACAVSIVTLPPAQAASPAQPTSVDPVAGVAVIVTVVP